MTHGRKNIKKHKKVTICFGATKKIREKITRRPFLKELQNLKTYALSHHSKNHQNFHNGIQLLPAGFNPLSISFVIYNLYNTQNLM